MEIDLYNLRTVTAIDCLAQTCFHHDDLAMQWLSHQALTAVLLHYLVKYILYIFENHYNPNFFATNYCEFSRLNFIMFDHIFRRL